MSNIKELLNNDEESVSCRQGMKHIKSRESGKDYIIPGHVSDFVEFDTKTIVDTSLGSSEFDDSWNLRHANTRIRKKTDYYMDAIPEYPRRKHDIKDIG